MKGFVNTCTWLEKIGILLNTGFSGECTEALVPEASCEDVFVVGSHDEARVGGLETQIEVGTQSATLLCGARH